MALTPARRAILILIYPLLRPLLFRLDPETSHNLVMPCLSTVGNLPIIGKLAKQFYFDPSFNQPTQVMGLDFPNPLGLAAGLDKQGNCANIFSAMGFGFVEMGTVTPRPQPGNDRPRLFRLTEQSAIINRMGFNSVGLDAFINNVQQSNEHVVKGINIGKNALTPIQDALNDYVTAMRASYAHADYITVNISSPNTRNLRDLQQDDALDELLAGLAKEHQVLRDTHGKHVPMVLKIAPDLSLEQVDVVASLCRNYRFDGVAATNTTLSREGVETNPLSLENGGLSGPPVTEKSTNVVHRLYQNLQGEVAIIGIGGIDSATSAQEKLNAGADLIQLYTGFIYQGPALVKTILRHLAQTRKQPS